MKPNNNYILPAPAFSFIHDEACCIFAERVDDDCLFISASSPTAEHPLDIVVFIVVFVSVLRRFESSLKLLGKSLLDLRDFVYVPTLLFSTFESNF